MLKFKIPDFKIYLFITVFFNLFFYFQIYFGDNILYSGKDSIRLHYATRYFIHESLIRNEFPFWTDKMFGGYPIFYDLERGIQNVLNLVLIYTLGPTISFAFLFFLTFLIGNIFLYLLIKKLFDANLTTILLCHFLYFYSFFVLLHLQHQNFTYTVYTFPAIIYLSQLFIETKKIRYLVSVSLLYNFIITFGALQMVFIAFIGQVLFLIFFNKEKFRSIKLVLILLFFSIFLSVPSLHYFYEMYKISAREERGIGTQGQFNLNYFASFVFPFVLGNDDYRGQYIKSDYQKHEYIIYFSLSTLLVSIYYLFLKSVDLRSKLFFIGILILLFVANFSLVPPFNMFRYWVRFIFLINFSLILLLAGFLSKKQSHKISFLSIISLLIVTLLFLINFFDADFRFVFKLILENIKFEILLMFTLSLLVLLFLRFPNILKLIIAVELAFFVSRLDINLYLPRNFLNEYFSKVNVYENRDDDYSLLRKGPSLSGYTPLAPNTNEDSPYKNHLDDSSLNYFFTYYIFIISGYVLLLYLITKHFLKRI